MRSLAKAGAMAAVAVLLATPVWSQTCSPDASVILTAGESNAIPAGHTRLELVDTQGNTVGGFTAPAVAGASWTPTQQNLDELATARRAAGAGTILLRWSGAAGVAACTQRFRLDSSGSVGTPPVPPRTLVTPDANEPAAETAWSEGECRRAAERWAGEIRREVGSDDFTQLVFLEDRGVCHRNRDYGVAGDPIYVGVFTDEKEAWDGVGITYDPCSIEPAAPLVLVNDEASVLGGFQAAVPQWTLRTYPPRTCFNTQVTVTVTGSVGGKTLTARTIVEQSQLYRATLHLGALFTTLHDRSYGLRPDGADQRIYSKGPTDRGPEYYAAVVLYALPRYIPSLFGGERYRGRDVVRDNALVDRIGGVVGVGISDPRKQFVLGLAFEALAGVNVTGTWNFARVTDLADLEEGAVFTGAETAIPLRQEWDNEFVLGVSLDLRYVSALTKR